MSCGWGSLTGLSRKSTGVIKNWWYSLCKPPSCEPACTMQNVCSEKLQYLQSRLTLSIFLTYWIKQLTISFYFWSHSCSIALDGFKKEKDVCKIKQVQCQGCVSVQEGVRARCSNVTNTYSSSGWLLNMYMISALLTFTVSPCVCRTIWAVSSTVVLCRWNRSRSALCSVT